MKLPFLALALALVACHSDSKEDLIADANVDNDKVDTDVLVPGGTNYRLDTSADPVLVFTAWGMMNQEQYGTWTEYEVQAGRADDGIAALLVSFTFNTDSVDTGNNLMTSHLKSDDFFDVANHPTGSFTSNSISDNGDGTFAVAGEMTLRGTTKALTYTATIDEANDVIHTTATIEFSRWDFGLYPADATGPGDDGVGDNVVVEYDVKLELEES
jgi:polyisoprenoid-binding protein YceI